MARRSTSSLTRLVAAWRQGGTLALGLALLAAILVMVNFLAARHGVRGDWTPSRIFSLSDRTLAVLRSLRQPVRVTTFAVPPDRFSESVHREVDELLARFARASQRVRVERVDIDADPARAELLAREYNISRRDLRQGVVVIASAGRSRYVRVSSLARYDGQRLVAFGGESALLSALLSVSSDRPQVVCFSAGHGEAAIDSYEEAGIGYIADEVRRESFSVKSLDATALAAGVSGSGCRALVVVGPTRRFDHGEVEAIDRFVRGGGGVVLLVGPLLDRRVTRYGQTGIEDWVAQLGIELPMNVVIDPLALPGEQRLLTWGTRQGYDAVHPVSRALAGRLTIWRLAREVRVVAGRRARVTRLVSSSVDGWGETDLASLRGERPLRRDAAVDSRGPVSVAAAAAIDDGGRVVVIGSERGVLNRRLADDRDHSRDLFITSVAWVVGRQDQVALGPKRPEHMRLSLDRRQLTRVFLLAVVALPGCALLSAVVVWRRRRR